MIYNKYYKHNTFDIRLMQAMDDAVASTQTTTSPTPTVDPSKFKASQFIRTNPIKGNLANAKVLHTAMDYGVYGGTSRADMQRIRNSFGRTKQDWRNVQAAQLFGSEYDPNKNYSRQDLRKARKMMRLSKQEWRDRIGQTIGKQAMHNTLYGTNTAYRDYMNGQNLRAAQTAPTQAAWKPGNGYTFNLENDIDGDQAFRLSKIYSKNIDKPMWKDMDAADGVIDGKITSAGMNVYSRRMGYEGNQNNPNSINFFKQYGIDYDPAEHSWVTDMSMSDYYKTSKYDPTKDPDKKKKWDFRHDKDGNLVDWTLNDNDEFENYLKAAFGIGYDNFGIDRNATDAMKQFGDKINLDLSKGFARAHDAQLKQAIWNNPNMKYQNTQGKRGFYWQSPTPTPGPGTVVANKNGGIIKAQGGLDFDAINASYKQDLEKARRAAAQNPYSSWNRSRITSYQNRGIDINDRQLIQTLKDHGYQFDMNSQMLKHKGADGKDYYYGQDGKVYSDFNHRNQVGTWDKYNANTSDWNSGAATLGYRSIEQTKPWYTEQGLYGGIVKGDKYVITNFSGNPNRTLTLQNTPNGITFTESIGNGIYSVGTYNREGNESEFRRTGFQFKNGKPVTGWKWNNGDAFQLDNYGYSTNHPQMRAFRWRINPKNGKLQEFDADNHQYIDLKDGTYTFYKQGGKLNKFQQGGTMEQNNQEQLLTYATLGLIGYANANQKPMDFTTAVQQVMQMAEQKPEALQEIAENKELIQMGVDILKQQEPEVLQMISQPGGMSKVISQVSQKAAQVARHGAKLNFIQDLKGMCPDGYEPSYMKAGGKVCKICKKKMQKLGGTIIGNEIPAGAHGMPIIQGGISSLMNSIKADLFKKGGKTKKCTIGGEMPDDKKKKGTRDANGVLSTTPAGKDPAYQNAMRRGDRAAADSILINKYNDEKTLMSTSDKDGKYVNGKWVPNRNSSRYVKK